MAVAGEANGIFLLRHSERDDGVEYEDLEILHSQFR